MKFLKNVLKRFKNLQVLKRDFLISMNIGDYIGFGESLKDEFKEFVIKIDPEVFVEPSEIETIIKTGILPNKFNDIIYGNLFHYFQVYLPKYISAFANCENLDEGFLYFGINNIGEITGIPVLGEITNKSVQIMIDSVKDSLGLERKNEKEVEYINMLFSEISIEVIKLEKNLEFLDDNGTREINERTEKHIEYLADYKKFLEERNKWLEEIMSFTTKISYIILDKKIRTDIANYIRTSGPQRPEVQKQADILDSDVHIEILNGIQLNDYKNSDENVYYWVMFYKDLIIQEIRSRKPIKPIYTYGAFESIYMNYFQLLTKMRYKFITNNTECNYYVIKIRIPGKKDIPVYYKHPVYDWKWMMKVRSIGSKGPCCI